MGLLERLQQHIEQTDLQCFKEDTKKLRRMLNELGLKSIVSEHEEEQGEQ